MHAVKHASALPSGQNHEQCQYGKQAAPKRDFKAFGVLQLTGDHTSNRPHERANDHENDGLAVGEILSYWAHLMVYFMRSRGVLDLCRLVRLSFCTLGKRMLLPLMVRGYAQIASTAFAHPATKMVAARGFTASEIAGDLEPHILRHCDSFGASQAKRWRVFGFQTRR